VCETPKTMAMLATLSTIGTGNFKDEIRATKKPIKLSNGSKLGSTDVSLIPMQTSPHLESDFDLDVLIEVMDGSGVTNGMENSCLYFNDIPSLKAPSRSRKESYSENQNRLWHGRNDILGSSNMDCTMVAAAPVLPPGYVVSASRIADRRMMLAGYRLADLLTRIRGN
jgi:hypothetical protein